MLHKDSKNWFGSSYPYERVYVENSQGDVVVSLEKNGDDCSLYEECDNNLSLTATKAEMVRVLTGMIEFLNEENRN